MRHMKEHTPVRYILAVAVLTACQACTPNISPNTGNPVAKAYNQSGTVQIPPYTRSIINTTNF